jgi:hypothetical protein
MESPGGDGGVVALPVIARRVRRIERIDVPTLSSGCRPDHGPERIRITAGIGIDEDFVSIESLAGGIRGAIDPVSVVCTGSQPAH